MDARQKALALFVGSQLVGDSLEDIKTTFRDAVGRDPIGSIMSTVLIGGVLFYEAEHGQNPKVNTLSDALVFVSTSLSVGYSDIFPKTEKGKLIATALQTFGPGMSAQALDPPHIAMNKFEDDSLVMQQQLIEKLDAILVELKAQRKQ